MRSKKLQGCIGNPKTKSPFPNLRIVGISNNDFNGPLLIKYLKAMTNVDEGKVALKYTRVEYYQDSLNITIIGLHVELVTIKTIFTTLDF